MTAFDLVVGFVRAWLGIILMVVSIIVIKDSLKK